MGKKVNRSWKSMFILLHFYFLKVVLFLSCVLMFFFLGSFLSSCPSWHSFVSFLLIFLFLPHCSVFISVNAAAINTLEFLRFLPLNYVCILCAISLIQLLPYSAHSEHYSYILILTSSTVYEIFSFLQSCWATLE